MHEDSSLLGHPLCQLANTEGSKIVVSSSSGSISPGRMARLPDPEGTIFLWIGNYLPVGTA
jgi:hypothetical protein